MTNLQRRLRKIEAYMTDTSGLVPHTPRWLEYWDRPRFCPAFGYPLRSDLDQEILLTYYEPLTNSITVRIVARTAKVWASGRPASNYSQLMVVPQTGLTAGFKVLRTRISQRPFSDSP